MRVERLVAPTAGCKLLKSIVLIILGFSYLDEVTYFSYHTHHRGSILLNNSVVHFFEAEGVEGAFLHGGTVDTALDLLDFDLCHCESVAFSDLTFEHLFYRDTAVLGDGCG